MTHLYGPADPEPKARFECVCGWTYYDANYQTCRNCGAEL